jgi:phage tail sheath protein FI
MGFQVSPGVNVSEIDLTTIIPAVSTTNGGFVGQFVWGPVGNRVLIDSEVTLVSRFGKPDSNTFTSFWPAANFLAYGNSLRVSRATNANTFNATANNLAAIQIKNEDFYTETYAAGQGAFGEFAARYPGALGNALIVSICPSANAFYQNLTAGLAVTASIITIGQTVIGISSTTGTSLIAGDTVRFGKVGPFINVTTVTSSNITLESSYRYNVATGSTVERRWFYASQFDSSPKTSTYVKNLKGANDEIHVIVTDRTGAITGVPGTIVEKYPFLSKASDAKTEDGSTNYYPSVLYNKSRWIYWGGHQSGGTNWGNTAANTSFTYVTNPLTRTLGGGTTVTATDADTVLAWDLFKDADQVDVSLLPLGEASATVISYVIDNIAEARRDCVVFFSPSRASVVNNAGNEVDAIVAFNDTLSDSSYAVLDSGWKYQYDKYADAYRYVPLNGDIAGLCVRTDTTRDPWFSPAGFNRGAIKNVVRLAWNPTRTDRDQLYQSGINPVVTFPGEGTILYGDKTCLSKPSAFDRINVRRLFIVLEKAIARAAKYSLFEFNDEFTRASFVSMVEPFLRDIQGRRGIYDFRVVCDTSNNTGEVIDRNEFIGDIYIKPARSINFIQLNFVAVRTGVSFDEVVGKF